MMRVSVRESKMVTDRLLMLTGLELGLIPAVREFLLAAETVGAGAFRFMHDELLTVTDLAAPRLAVTVDEAGMTVVDCAGQYAPVAGPSLLNLVSLRVRAGGTAAIRVRRARDPSLLRGLVPLTNRRGILSVVLTGGEDGSAAIAAGSGQATALALHGILSPTTQMKGITSADNNRAPVNVSLDDSCLILATTAPVTEGRETDEDTAIGSERWHAVTRGIEVDPALWWALYHRSNEALTPTSDLSRRHAGPSLDKLYVEW